MSVLWGWGTFRPARSCGKLFLGSQYCSLARLLLGLRHLSRRAARAICMEHPKLLITLMLSFAASSDLHIFTTLESFIQPSKCSTAHTTPTNPPDGTLQGSISPYPPTSTTAHTPLSTSLYSPSPSSPQLSPPPPAQL